MTQFAGVLKIVRFNWPWYVAAIGVTTVILLVFHFRDPPGSWLVMAVLMIGNFWLFASLAVSHYVYDRSPISRGGWLMGVDSRFSGRIAVFHAGQDEASESVARLLPSAQIQTFDFFDSARNGTASLKRARALATQLAASIAPDDIPLGNDTIDLALVVFAAHEIRREDSRISFFQELARVVDRDGRIRVVEHLRDGWNLLAYGPGVFHFLSGKSWRHSFAEAGLRVLSERACTQFVRVFELGKIR